jgi:hypothetical protein
MNFPTQTFAEHIAASCAANLWNVLPQIMNLQSKDGFERLVLHFEHAIELFTQGRSVVPEPSIN